MSLQQISMDRYGKDYDDLALIQRMYVIKDFLKIAKKEADIYCSLPKKLKQAYNHLQLNGRAPHC